MKVWDAELLTAKSGVQPVTDGLLFWLDGRDELIGDSEYGSYTPPIYATSHMYDRVGDKLISWSRSSTSGGLQQEDGLLMAAAPFGNGGQTCVIESVDNVLSVEITFGFSKTGYSAAENMVSISSNRIFFPIVSSSAGAKIEAANAIYNAPVHLVFQGYLSTYKPLIYQNGVIASVTGSSAVALAAYSIANLINIPTGTRIASIRLYNRMLTDSEIQQNIQYEISTGRLTI